MDKARTEKYYYAKIKNKDGKYEKIGRECGTELLCVGRLNEWISLNKKYDEEHNELRYDYNSWEIVEEVIEIQEKIISSKTLHGKNQGWCLITESEKDKILYNKRDRERSNLNELIKDYKFTHFKFLSQHIWGLEHPLLDHFIAFKDASGEEYLISHTYLNESEIKKEMEQHDDLKYEILDGIFYGWYEYRTTNFVMFKKKK